MITVANPYIQTKIEILPESPMFLIVENPREYFKTVCQLKSAMCGEESEFTFWDGVTQLQPTKIGEMLTDIFSFEFTDRKIISLLYKKLQNNYLEGEFILGLNSINAQVGIFLQSLFQTVDFSLDYSDLMLEDLLKSCGVKPSKTYSSFLEKLICYINIFIELKNIKFFIFIGLREVLTDEELKQLYYHCDLQKIGLFLVESYKKQYLMPCERAIIITEDLCEIAENLN